MNFLKKNYSFYFYGITIILLIVIFLIYTTRYGRSKSHVTWLESGDASRRIPKINNVQPGARDENRTSIGSTLFSRIPDLVFYYSDDNTISTYSKFTFGTTLILNISGNITDKSITNKSNKIGYFTEYKMCNPTVNNAAYVTNIETFYLKNGSIQIQPAGIQPKNFQGNYTITPNTTGTFRIISGTENYLKVNGYVTIKTYDNLERKVSVYFD